MNKNIFEGAKFGDKFVSRDGKVARFICITKLTENTRYCLYVENEQVPIWYNENGENLLNKEKLNIVSHYQYPIDEEKLEELAEGYIENVMALSTTNREKTRAFEAYKAGYHKAKEDLNYESLDL